MKLVLCTLACLAAPAAYAQGFSYLGTDVTLEGFTGQQQLDGAGSFTTEGFNLATKTDLSFGNFGVQIDLTHLSTNWDGYNFTANTLALYPWYQISPSAKVGLMFARTDQPNYSDFPGYDFYDEYGIVAYAKINPSFDMQVGFSKSPENNFTSRAAQALEFYGRYRFSDQLALRGDLFIGQVSIPSANDERNFNTAALRVEYSPGSANAVPMTYYASLEYANNEFYTPHRAETRLRLGATFTFGSKGEGLPKFEHADYIREMMSYD